MIRDPFIIAREVTPTPLAQRAIAHALGGKVQVQGRVLIANPARWPQNVSDAEPTADCTACVEPVWVAPSSRAEVAKGTPIVCIPCLEKAADALDPTWRTAP